MTAVPLFAELIAAIIEDGAAVTHLFVSLAQALSGAGYWLSTLSNISFSICMHSKPFIFALLFYVALCDYAPGWPGLT